MHFEACTIGDIDPEVLAERLFFGELKSYYDTFYGAVGVYADLLGKKGLEKYRVLAENEWAKLPALSPGSEEKDSYGLRYQVTNIMESLAKETGDLEAVIAIKKKDLSSPRNYLQIAHTYKEAGKNDLALAWAEEGVKAFPDKVDRGLREFLIKEYLCRNRFDEAMSFAWEEFMESPCFNHYCRLKRHASQVDQWPLWRSKALELIRSQIIPNKSERGGYSWHYNTGHSVLVQIYLWENDLDSAWKEASEGGCSDSLWMELADKRKETHPEEVIPIYQRALEAAINRGSNDGYALAVELLKVTETLMTRIKRKTDFLSYLNAIRVNHKLKRNLMKLIQLTWGSI